MKFHSRMIASLLLLLLPVQATAVVMACPHAQASADAAVSVAAAEAPCVHGGAAPAATGDAEHPPASPSDSACCAASAACMMCGLAFDGGHTPLLEQHRQSAAPPAAVRFSSFYPEGLQRPPRNIA